MIQANPQTNDRRHASMLEPPELNEQEICTCLQDAYGLRVAAIAFLPLGADLNTAVYRIVTADEQVYFAKLRKGDFQEASVTVPNYLAALGFRQMIPALPARSGQPWAHLAPYRVILYPFVDGRDGFAAGLSHAQWVEFGAALKRFHTAAIPAALTAAIQRETFSPQWRQMVRRYLAQIEIEPPREPVALALATFLQSKQADILDLVAQSERLAQRLQAHPPAFILCHADIHGWNLLVDDGGALYIVDWDTLIFAPKERDLMFIGGGLGDSGHPPQEEETLFYQGYGPPELDLRALAYYRSERIVEDIAVYCEQILGSDDGGADRRQALDAVTSNFLPNGTIECARLAGERVGDG